MISSKKKKKKKKKHDAQISDTEYFTISDYIKITGEIINAKIKEMEVVDKSNIFGFTDLNKKIAT